MEPDQEDSTGQPDERPGRGEEQESGRQATPDPASMGGSVAEHAGFQEQSSAVDPSRKNDQLFAPNMDDSPQAAVEANAMPSEKMDSHDMPTSPVSVNKIERGWFKAEEVADVRTRWTAIQSQFVDEPCSAVEQGEALVAETAERVKQMISAMQLSIGQQWLNHDDISTEELRKTLLDYRALLNHMLNL